MLSLLIILIVGFLSFVFLILKCKQFKRYKDLIDKIPGPPALPIIGNCHQLFGTQDVMFIKARAIVNNYKPLIRFWIGTTGSVNLIDPRDIEVLISTTKNHEKSMIYDMLHPWLGSGLLTSAGSKWQTRRKILTPSFHFNILQQFLSVFIEQTTILVNEIKESKEKDIDVVPPITNFTLHSICETAMGTSVNTSKKDQEIYKDSVHKFGEHITYRIKRPWFIKNSTYFFTTGYWKMMNLCKKLHSFSARVIEEKKKKFKSVVNITNESVSIDSTKKRMAMLDVLLSAKLEGANIDDEGIREEVDTFMFEGHDTTSVSICFTLMLLACNRKCQDKIYEEIKEVFEDLNSTPTYRDLTELKYMERCIKESLRLYPSVPFFSRITSGVNELPSGYTVPDKTIANIHVYDLHREPQYFPDPEKFDPDRFLPENIQKRHPFAYIPFSAGPRNCIGQKFAILELKTVLLGILKNFILEPIDTPETIHLIIDIVLRTRDGVKVRFVPRETNCS